MSDVDPFSPGPTWDELQDSKTGGQYVIRAPRDFHVNGRLFAKGRLLTMAEARECGLNVVTAVRVEG